MLRSSAVARNQCSASVGNIQGTPPVAGEFRLSTSPGVLGEVGKALSQVEDIPVTSHTAQTAKVLGQSNRLAFISHASEDDDLADEVAQILTAIQVRTWIDNAELHRNSPLELVGTRVWDGLQSATDVIAIASQVATEKPWVKHEWLTASGSWLASGSPRIHIVTRGRLVAVPELPYTSLTAEGESLAPSLRKEFAPTDPSTLYPATQVEWAALGRDLRSQYLMGGPTAVQAIHRFDLILPELVRVVDAAVAANFEGEHVPVLNLVRTLALLLDLRADPSWLSTILEVAAKTAAIELRSRNILLNNAGMANAYVGNWGPARQSLVAAVDGCNEDNDLSGAAMACGNIALIELDRGDIAAAEEWILKARQVLDEASKDLNEQSDRNVVVEALTTRGNLANHLGRVHVARGQQSEAIRHFGIHLAIAESLESRRAIGVALGRAAWAHLILGEIEDYTGILLERYMAISVSTFNPRGIANAHNWLGQLWVIKGNHGSALQNFHEEFGLRVHLQDRLGMIQSLCWLCVLQRALGHSGEHEVASRRLQSEAAGVELGRRDSAMVQIALATSTQAIKPEILSETRAAGAAFRLAAALEP